MFRQRYATSKNSSFSVSICKHFCLPFASLRSNSCPRPRRVCYSAGRHLDFSTMPSNLRERAYLCTSGPRFRRRGLLSTADPPTNSASPAPHRLDGGGILSVGPRASPAMGWVLGPESGRAGWIKGAPALARNIRVPRKVPTQNFHKTIAVGWAREH